MWEGNKSQAGSLESIILDGAKRIRGCSSKTCNEAVRGDMGLDTLQRKVWSRMVDNLFKSLDIDKSEWLEDIKHGDSPSASFMASVYRGVY